MSDCDEPCDSCPAKAEHHLCDLCCHEEPDAINKENRELREMLKKLEEEVEFLRGLCTYTASNINNQLFDFDRRPGGPLEPLKTQVRAQPRKKGSKS